jgi:uncharacterized membrane protein
MKQSKILISLTAAIALNSSTALADNENEEMEKCIATVNGKSLIKEHKADCNTPHYSCAGKNAENDQYAWIIVPKGECAKIKIGDYSGLSKKVKEKLIETK